MDLLVDNTAPLNPKERDQLVALMADGKAAGLFNRLVDSVAAGDMPLIEGPGTLRMDPCKGEKGELALLFTVHIPRLEVKTAVPARLVLRAMGPPGTEKAAAIEKLCDDVRSLGADAVTQMATTLASARAVGRKVREGVKNRRKAGGDAGLVLVTGENAPQADYASVFIELYCGDAPAPTNGAAA